MVKTTENKPETKKDKKKDKELKTIIKKKAVKVPDDCPLDRDTLGVYTWGLLHTIAAYYPNEPTIEQQRDMLSFIHNLSRLRILPPVVESQMEFARWLCKIHNRVNQRLGKPLFDCSKLGERWKYGWEDGSCDG